MSLYCAFTMHISSMLNQIQNLNFASFIVNAKLNVSSIRGSNMPAIYSNHYFILWNYTVTLQYTYSLRSSTEMYTTVFLMLWEMTSSNFGLFKFFQNEFLKNHFDYCFFLFITKIVLIVKFANAQHNTILVHYMRKKGFACLFCFCVTPLLSCIFSFCCVLCAHTARNYNNLQY